MSHVTSLICLLLSSLFLNLPVAGAETLDLSKALIIGGGPKKVVEFTDPDCSFCRKATRYFENRKDVTKYVFFLPLDRHPDAKNKIRHILSATDSVKTYYEVMSGKMDQVDSKTLQMTPAGTKLQELHQQAAKKAGVSVTPTFMIQGRIIEGFDLQRIEELLGK